MESDLATYAILGGSCHLSCRLQEKLQEKARLVTRDWSEITDLLFAQYTQDTGR